MPVAAAEEAQGIVWLSKDVDGLAALLHPGIRWVQLPDAGVDRWLDAGLAAGPWIVTSARGTFGPQVAEQPLALLLAGARRLHVSARERAWPAERRWGVSLRRRTVAVVGAAHIGGCLLDRLRPLGARTVAVTRRGLPVASANVTFPLEALPTAIEKADALVLAAPGTPQNRHLIGSKELDRLSAEALLVNVGRGTLLAALDEGRLRGARRHRSRATAAGASALEPRVGADHPPLGEPTGREGRLTGSTGPREHPTFRRTV